MAIDLASLAVGRSNEGTADMSEYVEKCPCCNNHSLEVTQHDWGDPPAGGEERRCELCGFAVPPGRGVAPSLPTQAHVGNQARSEPFGT